MAFGSLLPESCLVAACDISGANITERTSSSKCCVRFAYSRDLFDIALSCRSGCYKYSLFFPLLSQWPRMSLVFPISLFEPFGSHKLRYLILEIIFNVQFSRYNRKCEAFPLRVLLTQNPVWIVSSFTFNPVETERFELSTPCLQGRCSPN